jgi:preprotein translocase SecE subunit
MGRKDRKRRREEGDPPDSEQSGIHRATGPDEWEHSGDVDQFEAALVGGAEGEVSQISDEDLAKEAQEALGRSEVEPATTGGRPQRVRASGSGAAPGQATQGGFRLFAFFRASWAELQRVQWPDRRQVAQATAVVIGFVIIAGLYLGLADRVAQAIVDFII